MHLPEMIVRLNHKTTPMKFRLILSLLLLTTCVVAYSQENQSHMSKVQDTAAAEKGLIKVSVMYPYAEGKTFDMEYYETKHMPMMAKILGANLVKYTIEKGLSNGMPNQPLPYMAIGTFYVKSHKEYLAAVGPNIAAIRADIPKYTNITPVIFVSEVIR
jgi:uncharacterized protein (TIGR02118 family)